MKKIVILGGGFGGVRTAILLRNRIKDAEIILIDKNSYHSYTPSLYEVATAYKGGLLVKDDLREEHFKSDIGSVIAFPFSDIFKHRNILTIHQPVKKINGRQDKVILDDGTEVDFDYLVVALGSQSNYFNIEGAEKYCFPIKTVGEALNIRDSVRKLILDSKESRKDITITVIGAGLSGFEVATEMARFVRKLKKRHSMEDVRVDIKLVEASDKILSVCYDKFRDKANKRLKKLEVQPMLNKKIVKVEYDKIHFEDGDDMNTDISIWTCGISGVDILKDSVGIGEVNKRGQVVVSEYLSTTEKDNVFVVGDCVGFVDSSNDTPAPQTAWAAEQEAGTVAYNIYAILKGKTPKKHRVQFLGLIASAGGKYAIANVMGMTISGFLGWVIKRMVDLKYLTSMYNPISALIIWIKGVNIFGRND